MLVARLQQHVMHIAALVVQRYLAPDALRVLARRALRNLVQEAMDCLGICLGPKADPNATPLHFDPAKAKVFQPLVVRLQDAERLAALYND